MPRQAKVAASSAIIDLGTDSSKIHGERNELCMYVIKFSSLSVYYVSEKENNDRQTGEQNRTVLRHLSALLHNYVFFLR